MNLEKLVKSIKDQGGANDGYWYLASPYSDYPLGVHWACVEISRVSGLLMSKGIVNVCPIAGSHNITLYAEYGGAFEHWQQLDKALIAADTCQGIIATKMNTWEKSKGMKAEIDFALKINKHVLYLDYEGIYERSNERKVS